MAGVGCPMRVLMLSHYFPSGQMTHVFSLAKELMRQGHRVHVVNGRVRTLAQWRYTRALAGGVPCTTRWDAPHLVSLVRRLCVEVIHAHSKRTFALGARLSQRTGVPLVITCHARTLIRPAYEPFFRQAVRLICPWQTLAEVMGPRGGRTRVVPNGIDLDAFPFRDRPARERLRVLYLGRIDQSRRPGVEALCHAVRDLHGVELIMASDRPAAPWVKFVGWLSQPAAWLSECDVVVGTGRAVMEGLATGCAALVLGEGWDGLLTPENAEWLARDNFIGRMSGMRPSPGPIRAALMQLARDAGLRRELGRWGRKFVAERFDIRRIAAQTADVYAEAACEGLARRAAVPAGG